MFTSNYASSMARVSAWLADWLIRRRVPMIIVLSLITVFLGYHASFLRMDPGFTKSIPLGHPYMETYTKYTDQFGGANVIIVALMQKEGDIFNVDFFKTLETATSDVLFIKGVDRSSVTSLFTPNVDYVLVDEEGFAGVTGWLSRTSSQTQENYRAGASTRFAGLAARRPAGVPRL